MSVAGVIAWTRDPKLSTAGLVLVIAGCLALVSLSRRVHRLKPRTAVSVSSDAAMSAGATPTPSEQAGTERTARSTKMRSEFEASGNDVDFIQQALSRPQEGGKFYALLAWKRCSDLAQHRDAAAEHTGGDAFHDHAVALVARWRRSSAAAATPCCRPTVRRWVVEIVACELVGNCRGGLAASLHCVDTGDCAHDDDSDVILARVPDAQRIVFDTMLAGLHQRVGLVAGRTDADDQP